MIDLKICVLAGHSPGAEELREPEWTGTLSEWADANADNLTWGEVRDYANDLAEGRIVPIGGGARPCFTLISERSRYERLLSW